METPQIVIPNLPHSPGVYIYRDAGNTILYIGKAKDLKRRVSQYFQRDDAVGDKTLALVSQIRAIETIQTDSEFDALLLEAKLIRTHLPKYNVVARDDKSPLYIVITTREKLPRVLWLRKTSLIQYPGSSQFGPFASGRDARMLMRLIRHIIPYCTQKQRTGKPCFYTHIALCSPCPSVIAAMEDSKPRRELLRIYRRNIRRVCDILSGKSLTVLHGLEREMALAAGRQDYEEAQRIKGHIEALRNLLARHFDPHTYLKNSALLGNVRAEESRSLIMALSGLFPALTKITRIECIDISNTMGAYSTGSLVVTVDGYPDTTQYRRFRIRRKEAPNDVAMIAEVLRRRLAHTEWPYPDLLVIDGGKGQVRSAKEVLDGVGLSQPVIGLAKRFEEIVVPVSAGWKIVRLPVSDPGLHLLERIRDESHRFALAYHRLLRRKAFLP